jgi:hypothetical protein
MWLYVVCNVLHISTHHMHTSSVTQNNSTGCNRVHVMPFSRIHPRSTVDPTGRVADRPVQHVRKHELILHTCTFLSTETCNTLKYGADNMKHGRKPKENNQPPENHRNSWTWPRPIQGSCINARTVFWLCESTLLYEWGTQIAATPANQLTTFIEHKRATQT